MFTFALRNTKEIIRDKVNLFFGLLFPVILLLLLTLIKNNIPIPENAPVESGSPTAMFDIVRLTPGIAIFGLSFITLFSGMLISKDRCSSFLLRLFTSPLKSGDYITAYTVPLFPMAVIQTIICYIIAIILGLKFSLNLLLAIATVLPAALFYIALGLICGSLLNDKAVGGICGALLTNVSAWLSGTWFDVSLLGGTIKKVAYALPFANAVDAGRAALSGSYSDIIKPLLIVSVYAVVFYVVAIIIFKKKMSSDNQ